MINMNSEDRKEEKRSRKRRERDQYIKENLPLVRYIANRLNTKTSSQVDVEDLISYGILGLIDAAEKYSPSKGASFKNYAKLRIKGAILDGLRETDWTPRSIRKMRRELETTYRELEQDLGRAALDEEVAERLDIDMEQFHRMLDRVKGISLGSIEEVSEKNPGDYDNIDNLLYRPDDEEVSPFMMLQRSELKHVVVEAIDTLPEKERLVISLYYYDELTMRDIGNILNLTESRVSQIHSRALLRLKGRIANFLSYKSGARLEMVQGL